MGVITLGAIIRREVLEVILLWTAEMSTPYWRRDFCETAMATRLGLPKWDVKDNGEDRRAEGLREGRPHTSKPNEARNLGRSHSPFSATVGIFQPSVLARLAGLEISVNMQAGFFMAVRALVTHPLAVYLTENAAANNREVTGPL